MTVIATINFHDTTGSIRQQLLAARKDVFDVNDRIVLVQSSEDKYPYVDAPGQKLIEIQQIVDAIDISNCFIQIQTANPNIKQEVTDLVEFYSYQEIPFDFSVVPGTYRRIDKKHKDTSCIKLWNHLYVGIDGNTNPCCVADKRFPTGNIDEINKHSSVLKSYMSNGYRVRACKKCYEDEDAGIKSLRIPCNYSAEDEIAIDNLDIRINNLCNFKCRMCSEEYSSAIQAETVDMYGKSAVLGHQQFNLERDSRQTRLEKFEQIKKYVTPSINKIYFAGGEPLMLNEHYKVLDYLLEIEHTELALAYTTNMSQLLYKGKLVTDYWKQFKNVTVGASIDASDRVAEYVRHGTVWRDIQRNLDTIKNQCPHVKLFITSTAGFLNIENLIDLQKHFIKTGYFKVDELKVSTLTHPNFLNSAALPAHHKRYLEEIIKDHINYLGKNALADQWADVLHFMINNDYSYSLSEFKQRMQVLDKHRGESFVDVFPQFADLYD